MSYRAVKVVVLFALLLSCVGNTMANERAGGVAMIALLSDLEGSAERLHDFLRRHPAFEQGPDGKAHLRAQAGFVFCGDCPDRFGHDRAVLRELLRLKREAPDRVILIAGNRDVNKLRLPLELSPAALARAPRQAAPDYRAWRTERNLPDRAMTRLQWIVGQTMAAPQGFALRRAELGEEWGTGARAVSDVAVYDSYLADAMPGGLFHQYLRAARVMVRRGATLFVHGGIPQAALARVPGDPQRARTVDAWVDKVNTWYVNALDQWEEGLPKWDATCARPGEDLLCYAEKWQAKSTNPFSVMYGRTCDEEGKVTLPSPAVIDWLRRQGIRRLVVGHTPSGQVPVVLRTDDGQFEQLVLDTSYGLASQSPLVWLEEPSPPPAHDGLSAPVRQGRPSPLDPASIGAIGIEAQAVVPARGMATVSVRLPFAAPGPIGHRTADGAIVIGPWATGWLTYRLGAGFALKYNVCTLADLP